MIRCPTPGERNGSTPCARLVKILERPAGQQLAPSPRPLESAIADDDLVLRAALDHRAPEVLAFALYLYEDLVQVPCVTKTTLPTLQSPSVFRPELNAPKSDRFVRNRDASLSEQLFDVSKAHAKSLSRPGESHPQPLAERYVNLSTHTAPIRRTHLVLSSSASPPG